MSARELELLLAADDPIECEQPAGFDWQLAVASVRDLKPRLEAVAERSFMLCDSVQDASYFASLDIFKETREGAMRVMLTVFGLTFSAFGKLFSSWEGCPDERLDDDIIVQLIDLTAAAGFVYISPETLRLPYTGPNPAFVGRDWAARYFDYS